MITFFRFLDEAEIQYKPETYKYQYSNKGETEWYHRKSFDGHKVEVRIKGHKTGSHHVDYFINDSTWRTGKHSPETRSKILGFVHNTISNHLKKHKPNSLWMSGDTDKKEKFYHSYARHLVKKNKDYREGHIPGVIIRKDHHGSI